MKTIAAYIGLRRRPGDVPFGQAPRKYQLGVIVIGAAVVAVMRAIGH